MFNFIRRLVGITGLTIIPMVANALPFEITPEGTLPTTVPQFGKTSAFYIVKNTTSSALNGNFVKSLPTNVSQVKCSPNYCGATFNLGPSGSATESCILKLTIKGPVSSAQQLLVCAADGTTCNVPDVELAVTEAPGAPFVGVAVGPYSLFFSQGYYPLLAASNDSGTTWTYPASVNKNATTNIDPNFVAGLLSGASCSGSVDKSICIGAGNYCTDNNCNEIFPLIALGKKNLTEWKFPSDVFTNLKTVIDPNFTGGMLSGASCSGSGGSTLCIAPGVYFANQTLLPLLALTTNGGDTWTYPQSIHTNLTTAIDPNFTGGNLISGSCSQNTCNRICIASGYFCKDASCNDQIPLVGMSTDNGTTWTYPHAIFQDLKTQVDPNFKNGLLQNASCTGNDTQALCTASGFYYNGSTTYPLLALTQNKGATWAYPPAIFQNLETTIGHGFKGGFFNGNGCSGNGDKAVCIAAGAYFTTGGTQLPIIAVTRDGGSTWQYPPFIYTKLRSVVDPNLVSAVFDGASCTGNGKTAICMAVGTFCHSNESSDGNCDNFLPLLALSTNGGKNWSYPTEIFSNLKSTIDPAFKDGFLTEVSCHGTGGYNFCVAAGQYNDENFNIFPLLAYSTDSGTTWTYPPAIYKDLTTKIDPNFAVGSFSNAGTAGGELILSYHKKINSMTKLYRNAVHLL